MNEQQAGQQGAGEHAAGRCVCEEFIGHVQDLFGVSPSVRQHLKNSRIEFLKAIRTVLDERIERMSKAQTQGTRVTVE
jgi:predicted metalloprotease